MPSIPMGDSQDPHAGEIGDIVEQLRRDFRKRDDLYEVTDETIFSEYELNIPEAYRKTSTEIRSPLALHIVNTVSAALSVNGMQLQFEPVRTGQSGELNAELREHFFEASWMRQTQESKRQLLRLFLNSLVSKGEAVLKTMERSKRAWAGYNAYSKKLLERMATDDDYKGMDYDAKSRVYDAKTEEYKRGAPYPIVTTDVPPETFYYLLGEDGFTVAAEVKQVPYFDCLTRYGHGIDAKRRIVPEAMALPRNEWTRHMDGATTLTMVEFWDYQRCVYLLYGPGSSTGSAGLGAGGTIVKTLKHAYGDRWTKTLRGPYFHALGTTTAARVPEKAGLGILFGFLRLFPALDQYLTIQSNAGFLYGFAAFKRNQPPGAQLPAGPFGADGSQTHGGSGEERIIPGHIYPYDISAVDMPRGGVDLDKILLQIRGFIELALPSVVQGMVSGEESGYALNQAAYLARLGWDPTVKNAEFALGERTSFESWLIERRIRETVYAWGTQPTSGKPRTVGRSSRPRGSWLRIGPDDLNGAHRYTARLDPETPSNKVIEVRTHIDMVKARFETEAQAIEALGGDPGEVERGLLVQDMKQDPVIKEKMRERVLQALQIAEQKQLEGAVNQLDISQPGFGQSMRPGQLPDGSGGAPGVPGQPRLPGQGGEPMAPTASAGTAGLGLQQGSGIQVQGPGNVPPNAQPLPGQG